MTSRGKAKKTNSKAIFISHASADKLLADALVDLLQIGCAVPRSEILCTSLEGMRIPNGKNFREFLKEQIQNPKLVILLLTKNYFVSEFCLCEMGASWGMELDVYPLLVSPLKYDDVKGVFGDRILQSIIDDQNLDALHDKLIKIVASEYTFMES